MKLIKHAVWTLFRDCLVLIYYVRAMAKRKTGNLTTYFM